ncbi:MAG TPA: 3-phosphoserine/phosphohydroxythreonine transaminase [Rhodanobacteraceae bacterium]|nr:3-phosphoserine/phosphohydroxythreonine transaminase [Rhodanobacteraceae bacterium]
MSRAWNFSAGPAALPEAVLCQARDELLEWDEARASVMELSHRGEHFIAMAERAEADLRQLLAIPSHYRVLFLQGGATQQFAQVPMNLALPGDSADYLLTGHWGRKAMAEAAPYVDARVAADNAAGGGIDIPPPATWQLDPRAAYVHCTPNETVQGIEFDAVPDCGDVPLVADMTSDILSQPLDVSRFGLIYAGAQKNLGASGLLLMIVREDLLRRKRRPMARIFNYAEHAAAPHAMLNTPNTFGWYLAGLVLRWLLEQGGLVAVAERNAAKAALLYQAIDGSGGFYINDVVPAVRSRMNVPFRLHDAALDAAFLAEAETAGLIGLKGHSAVGGVRASLYNAMPLAGVQALVEHMRDFVRRHG